MATHETHTPGRKAEPASTLQGAKDKVVDAASSAVDTVKEVAGAAADKVRQVASSVRDKASQAASAVGDQVENVTDSVKAGGRYLQERDLSGMMEDFTDLVRRFPVAALLASVGVGFCMGRFLRS
jgi:ElaB/YqjD/DUF883 family membrane-anchored ribosome-binding protein